MELAHSLNGADDCGIESIGIFGGDPAILVGASACILNGEPIQICAANLKAGHEPATASLNIPIARDLNGIVFCRHRIEAWLLRWPRRESLHPNPVDQMHLGWSDGSPPTMQERDRLWSTLDATKRARSRDRDIPLLIREYRAMKDGYP